MPRTLAAVLALSLIATAAAAEVTDRRDDGFTLTFESRVSAPPEAIYAGLGQIGQWWDGGHTYSGDSANLTLDLKPGGCFCEALPGGGVQHGVVVLAWPEQMVRINAALGPLQDTDPAAVLTFSWSPAAEGGHTLTATYVVTGPGMGALAAPVDQVMAAQFSRLVDHLSAGPAA